LLIIGVFTAGDAAWQPDRLHASAAAQAEETRKQPAAEKTAPEIVPPPAPVPLSERIAEYHINVRLNETDHTLSGEQTVTWTNPGTKPVTDLYFHLYPNAFQSGKTTFMKESGGKLRNEKAQEGDFGYMRITTLRTSDGTQLLPRTNFIQPDDGNPHDETLMKLRLPEPVPPGGNITLKLSFEVKLPKVFARMGHAGDFVMAGQWFPKISAFEKTGVRGRTSEGWNLHQFHGNSEFYSNFGIYNVRIDVPRSYTVAATGFPIKPAVTTGDRKVVQFYADDVHDFAWAASPDFIYVEEPFSSRHVPGVKLKLYLDPSHRNLTERYLHAAKVTLDRLSEWYGEYPYSTLSIVIPPKGGEGAGGMEYPTLVTGAAAVQSNPGLELEKTVVHEIAHQYWYGIVATNEFEEAWLDEGFTSYTEDKIMESEYGIKPNYPLLSSYLTNPAPLKQPSWGYENHQHYADNVYMRAKLVLVAIEQQIGRKAMNRVLKTYYQRWKFRHPSTADFMRVLEQVTKKSWSAYFQQYVYGGAMVDFSVESAVSKPIVQNGETVYETTVWIKKHGGTYPFVPIVFRFKDGTMTQKHWDGQNEHMQFKLIHRSPLDWAAIDPHYSIVLENKRTNNFYKVDLPEQTKIRWNLSVAKLIEAMIGSVGW
jgi:hypothetical protein